MILEKLQHNADEEGVIMQTERAEDFLLALRHRIAQVNIFEGVDLVFLPSTGEAFAHMDQERFADIMMDMLERFAGARINEIEIATACNDEWFLVRITGRSECCCHPLSRAKRFFERNLALSGGLLQISHEANRPSVEIEFAAFRKEE
jgi:hypothetical protein